MHDYEMWAEPTSRFIYLADAGARPFLKGLKHLGSYSGLESPTYFARHIENNEWQPFFCESTVNIPRLYWDIREVILMPETQTNLDNEPKMRDNMSEIGKKYDSEKPRTDLLPPRALLEVAKVLGYGAKKYGPENWRKLDNLQNRYTGATLRHIFDHMSGLELDEETGYSHLAHAICCLLFKLEDELLDAENQAEGLRESVSGKPGKGSGTYESGGTRKTYHKEGSVRDSKHFVQYHETE